MTDYTELIRSLRCENTGDDECGSSDCPYWSGLGCMDGQLMEDAAAAIEELQAQLPKRGEWKETDMGWDGDTAWVCSVCGEPWTLIDGTPKENNMNFCPNCGAVMEVQDGQK